MLTRRGFTLVELLVALVLLGIVSAGIYRVLVTNQRVYHAQTQRIDLQQNIRAATTILPAELRELDAADGDLIAMTPTSITLRAPRWLGIACGAPVIGPLAGGAALVTMSIRTPLYGTRDPIATDRLLVYYEGDQGAINDDGWVLGPISQVLAGGTCPGDNRPNQRLVGSLTFGVNQFAVTGMIPNGAPVRGFEVVTYSVYQAPDGRWYLGYQGSQPGETQQPLIGPLRDANGVLFQYFNAAGAAAAAPAQVAQVRITVWAETAQRVQQQTGPRAYVTDSIVTTVSLRNNRRPNWVTIAPGS